jgi:hypothetical protein
MLRPRPERETSAVYALRLPAGPLREKLERKARKYKCSVAEIVRSDLEQYYRL